MELKQFMDRLQEMLTARTTKKVLCPGAKNPTESIKARNNKINTKYCKTCSIIMDLPKNIKCCPCYCYGKQEAYDLAQQKVNKFFKK